MTPYYQDALCTIYHGDCREVLPLPADVVVTDPPYPDWYTVEYRYEPGLVEAALDDLPCRQLVFWSAREPFPLSHTAIHIWNKNPSNHGAQYERIFERNGGSHCKVFTYYMVNSTVAAMMTRDVLVDHPSQKPIHLLSALVSMTKGTVLDPFMGSGTTLRAVKDQGRRAIGIEIDERYCEMAATRLAQEVLMLNLPEPETGGDQIALIIDGEVAS